MCVSVRVGDGWAGKDPGRRPTLGFFLSPLVPPQNEALDGDLFDSWRWGPSRTAAQGATLHASLPCWAVNVMLCPMSVGWCRTILRGFGSGREFSSTSRARVGFTLQP